MFLEYQKQSLKELHVINLKLADINEHLIEIHPKNKEQPVHTIPEIMHLLPIEVNNLEIVEDWLNNDLANQELLAKELSRIGGTKLGDLVRRIMYRTCTNELGILYSWEGAKKKNQFKSLTLAKVILNAVRISPIGKGSTEVEITNIIKYWLVRCKDRMERKDKENLEEIIVIDRI